MKANRMQKPMPKAARSRRVVPVFDHRREWRLLGPHRMHRFDVLDGEIDQRGTGEIEQRKEVEVGRQPERVGDRSRDQPANQITCHISGDVSRERAAGVYGAALFAEIGECQRKGRRHAQTLGDPQQGEDRKIGR